METFGVPNTRGVDWEAIYATELVYEANCWTKCGDAHCCHFSRHKDQFFIMGKKPFQELPLLPGEYEFLRETGRLQQFGEHEFRRTQFAIPGGRMLSLEEIVVHRPGCACQHAHRPTVCRLYPLFPVLDIDGRLAGVDGRFGIYEELEAIEGLARACKVGSVSFEQLDLFLRFVALLSGSPLHLYYLRAYHITKEHVSRRLGALRASSSESAFELFEGQFLRGELIDRETLQEELGALADAFGVRYGPSFRLDAASGT